MKFSLKNEDTRQECHEVDGFTIPIYFLDFSNRGFFSVGPDVRYSLFPRYNQRDSDATLRSDAPMVNLQG